MVGKILVALFVLLVVSLGLALWVFPLGMIKEFLWVVVTVCWVSITGIFIWELLRGAGIWEGIKENWKLVLTLVGFVFLWFGWMALITWDLLI